MNHLKSDDNRPIGKLIILKQFFHPHYEWNRDTIKFPDWLVLGHYDTIETHNISYLKDMLDHTQVHSSQFEYGPNSKTYLPLILNSLYTKSISNKEDLAKIVDSDPLFQLWIQMQLSAVTVDFMKRTPTDACSNNQDIVHFKCLSNGVDQIGYHIQSILDKADYAGLHAVLYRSMGSYEFNAELRFSKECDFSEVFKLLQELKSVEFLDVKPAAKDLKNHHVFGRVNALITFNRRKIPRSTENRNPSPNYKIVQHIRISPGHDDEALGLSNRRKYPTWIGAESKNLIVEFQGGFNEYVAIMEDQLTDEIQNTGSVYSQFLFRQPIQEDRPSKADTLTKEHAPIAVGEFLKKLMVSTRDKLKEIEAKKSFGEVQITEFNVLLNVAIQGLLRNDKQLFLLDLVPYILAIPDYLIGYQQLSEQGRLTSPERLRYLKAIDRSIGLLRRAVRNRIEEMSQSVDPMSLSNRSFVSPKLMAAYSICARVAWSFLFDALADKEKCHACAFVGTLGRVVVEEPLMGLREKIQTEIEKGIASSGSSKGSFTKEAEDVIPLPHLLFYDLSGPLLLRPEAVFLSTIHELAEHLEWRGPKTQQNFLGEYQRIITQTALERAAVYFLLRHEKYRTSEHQEVLSGFIRARLEAMNSHTAIEKSIFSAFDSMQDLVSEKAILDFANGLGTGGVDSNELRIRRKSLRTLLKRFRDFIVLARLNYGQSDDDRSNHASFLIKDIASLKSLIKESFADLAMIDFLDTSRRLTSPNPTTSTILVDHFDWRYVYHYLLFIYRVWSPDLFNELASLSSEDLENGFDNPRLSEFFHRAIVLHYIVYRTNSKPFDYSTWEKSCSKDAFDLYSSFCCENGVSLELEESLFDEYLQIQFEWLKGGMILNEAEEQDCIAAVLWRQFEASRNSWMETRFSKADHTKALLSEFVDLWDSCSRELGKTATPNQHPAWTDLCRVRFLESLWCESTIPDPHGTTIPDPHGSTIPDPHGTKIFE
jgi:hypothetical protein